MRHEVRMHLNLKYEESSQPITNEMSNIAFFKKQIRT